MIHYVTLVEPNGNETVLLTFDDELDAYKYALGCYMRDVRNVGSLFELLVKYRVDSVEPSKEFLSATYGKVAHRGHIYADTDSLAVQPQRGDFTMTELFGWYDGTKVADRLINCRECGCAVSYDNEVMEVHRQWHTKLLP